ncbi:MAG: DUF11 domain-containing protein [Armatimonadia bacterium]
MYPMTVPPKRVGLMIAGVLAAVVMATTVGLAALPPAGSMIGNQATATYTDASGVQHEVTSNIIYVEVQQVAAFTLVQDNTKYVTPGGQVAFPHTLTNTGNGSDTFNLSFAQLAGDNFDLQNVRIYADTNGDGLPDNLTPIAATLPLTAGSTFRVVVVATVPATAVAGNSGQITLTGASAFTPSVTQTNTDTAQVTSNAVVTALKSIDLASGLAGSGPRTYTIQYTNTGNLEAKNVVITDLIPANMTYVPGSGLWSKSGTSLTDAALGDPAGIAYDYNITTAGRVTATIASMPSGDSGTLTFQVMVSASAPPGPINNVANVSYEDGAANTISTQTNVVTFLVTATAGVTATGDTEASANQGSWVTFENVITNTGTATDTFDITIEPGNTFPAGTNFVLYKSGGVSQLLDTNGNGIPDTGPLAPGAAYSVILKAFLPASASGTDDCVVQKRATSANDTTVSAVATDTLGEIVGSTVDITNGAALGDPAATGAGAGPEVTAVTTIAGNPGTTQTFSLFVNNTSDVANTYNLQVTSDATLGSITLPAGVSVLFKNTAGTVISNTGMVNANSAMQVNAEVTIPVGMLAGTYDLYFRAISPTTASYDWKHDAVTVNAVRGLTITPNNIGQLYPGGSVVYSHTITNQSNLVEGDHVGSDVSLSLANSTSGFTSALYWDKDNDGVLGAGDIMIQDLSVLTGGTNGASTAAGLDLGESATLFVVVYASPGVPMGSQNITTVTATTSNTGYSGAVPAPAKATNNTTVIAGDVTLQKLQALDANADGAPEGAYVASNIDGLPGQCVRYKLVVTNTGIATALNVVVTDATPAFTLYDNGDGTVAPTGAAAYVLADATQHAAVAPADGAAGSIVANIGTLGAGDSATVYFGVKITQ